MNMELIQPFINSVDAVISETMHCSAPMVDVSMEVENYRRSGIAALVLISGEIQGRIILDMDAAAASQAASDLSPITGDASDETAREIVCELTNMVIGNSVTQLNNLGFKFKVHPPELFLVDAGPRATIDTETLVLRFDLPKGPIYLNIALQDTRSRLKN